MEKVDPEQMLIQIRAKGVKVARYVDSVFMDGRAVRHNFETATGRPVTWLPANPEISRSVDNEAFIRGKKGGE